MGVGIKSKYHIDPFDSAVGDREALRTTQIWKLNIPDNAAIELLSSPEDLDFLQRVNKMVEEGEKSCAIVNKLFDYYRDCYSDNFLSSHCYIV